MILLETALPADIYTRQNLFSFLLTYFNVWISTADSVIVLPVFCTAVQTLTYHSTVFVVYVMSIFHACLRFSDKSWNNCA
uniref:Uncharacterized protein n=1 Tax=Salix viminalis TaxID=40686 RepID=A0A6N2LTL2_SALVM